MVKSFLAVGHIMSSCMNKTTSSLLWPLQKHFLAAFRALSGGVKLHFLSSLASNNNNFVAMNNKTGVFHSLAPVDKFGHYPSSQLQHSLQNNPVSTFPTACCLVAATTCTQTTHEHWRSQFAQVWIIVFPQRDKHPHTLTLDFKPDSLLHSKSNQ